jgi:hypothetical protein
LWSFIAALLLEESADSDSALYTASYQGLRLSPFMLKLVFVLSQSGAQDTYSFALLSQDQEIVEMPIVKSSSVAVP